MDELDLIQDYASVFGKGNNYHYYIFSKGGFTDGLFLCLRGGGYANSIQGITVEIGGDTTKLSKALESVNKSIKGTQSGLKDVNKLLKLDPSNEKPERYPCGLPLELHE